MTREEHLRAIINDLVFRVAELAAERDALNEQLAVLAKPKEDTPDDVLRQRINEAWR